VHPLGQFHVGTGGGSATEHPGPPSFRLPEANQRLFVTLIAGTKILKEVVDDRRNQILHGSPLHERLSQLEGAVRLRPHPDEQLFASALAC
jgi:hypothetical protein